MDIRPLTHEDIASVCRVYRLANQGERRRGDAAPPSPKVILEEDLAIWEFEILVGTTFVGVVDEKIVGFVHWVDPAHITLLEVLPEPGWENRAYQLIRFAEGHFVESGIQSWTAQVNQPIRSLMEADGLRMVRTEWIRTNDLQTLRSLMVYGPDPHIHLFRAVESETPLQKHLARLHPRGNAVVVVVIGAILPMMLLAIDPILFRGEGSGLGLSQYRAFFYTSAAVAALNLLGAVLVPEMVGAIRAGVFFGSSLLVALLALALTPLSLFGLLFFGIGVLGILPWFVAWLYHRLGRWALVEERQRMGGPVDFSAPILCGMVLAWLPGFGVQRACEMRVDWHIARIESGGEAEMQTAVRELSAWYWLHSPREILHYRDPDQVMAMEARERLTEAYYLILEANGVDPW